MIDKLQYISQPLKQGSHLPAIEKALEAGCKWIQLRIKEQPANHILDQARAAKVLCDAFGAKLVINDHPEIASAVSAYGLHLGLLDMPLREARKIVGPEMIIGGTANTLEDVLQRVAEGANYVGLGPYRFTTTKKKLSPVLGMSGFEAIVKQLQERRIEIPIIAIGGITPNDVRELISEGIYGVALSGAITFATDPALTVTQITTEINQHSHPLKLKSC